MRRIALGLAVLVPWLSPSVAGETEVAGRPRGNLQIPGHLSEKSRKLVERAEAAYKEAFKAKKDKERLFRTAERKLRAAAKDKEAGKTALPHFRLGSTYNRLRKFEEARASLETAVQLNSRFYQAHVLLAEVLAKLGQVKDAVESFETTLGIYPGYRRALRGKVDALIRIGRFQEAIRTAAETLKTLKNPKKSPGPELARLIVYLTRELKGRDWKHVVETPNYRISTDISREFGETIGQYVELIRKAYTKVFPNIERPDRKYEVWIHRDREAYREAGGPPGVGGHYDPLLRRLVIYRYPKMENTTLVLYHEAFHQYLHEYLDVAPQWFNEGLGDYFAPFEYDYDRVQQKQFMRSRPNPWRLKPIQFAIRSSRVPSPGELMLMSRAEMYDRQTVGVNYAMAWSLVYFMIEHGRYRKILQRYFRELRKGQGIDGAYKNSFGKINMAAFEKNWKDFTLKIDTPK